MPLLVLQREFVILRRKALKDLNDLMHNLLHISPSRCHSEARSAEESRR